MKGDRFIPNRSLMDLDQAHCLLTTTTKKVFNPNFNVRFIILLTAFLLFLFFKCVKMLLGFFLLSYSRSWMLCLYLKLVFYD